LDGASNNQIPYISSTDDMITFFYSLITPMFNRLAPIDGPQELVLALGGEEVRVTLGVNRQLTFQNLNQLQNLNPSDLLTLRLYTNQDAGNILWEYSYGVLKKLKLHTVYDQARYTDDTNEF